MVYRKKTAPRRPKKTTRVSRSKSRRVSRSKSRSNLNDKDSIGLNYLELKVSNESNVKKTYKPVIKSTRLTTPLTIYTSPGCSACKDVQNLCNKKGIKFRVLNRRDHSEYVKEKTGNSQYVPNVFNSDNEYLGGNEDLAKLTKDMENIIA